jgi:type IV pilus assembly protein PilO
VALNTGLAGKPWYVGLGVGLFAGLLIFGGGYWQFVKGKQEEYAGLEAQLADLQTKIQEGRTAQKELPKFREEVRQLELELDKLLRILPARRNTPDLMRRIRALAEQGDFTLKRFTPGQLADKEFFSEWPITVNLEGGYHNLALFFDRVSRFSRIVNIEDLEISAIPATKVSGGGHTIGSNFIAKTFVYKEPEPPAADANQAGAAGKAPKGTNGGPAAKVTPGGGGND